MGHLRLSYPQSKSHDDNPSTYIQFEQLICDAMWVAAIPTKVVDGGREESYHAPGEVPL